MPKTFKITKEQMRARQDAETFRPCEESLLVDDEIRQEAERARVNKSAEKYFGLKSHQMDRMIRAFDRTQGEAIQQSRCGHEDAPCCGC